MPKNNIPEMDGYVFLETLHHQELSTSIPLLVLTADVQAETKLAQQQVPVIIKSFKCAQLLTAIQQYCQN